MKYFLVVGEASADLHASNLIKALKEQDAEAQFAFMGGDLMAEASGLSPIVHYRDVAFMGIIPVLRNLRTIQKAAQQVQQALLSFQPDVVIPIDFAGFNFKYILPFVRKHLACPIHYYIAPKLWAWKPWRIHTLRRHTDLLLCILPFEQDYFTQRGVRAIYVGNPSVESTQAYWSSDNLIKKTQIALLAGSRQQELQNNLPTMLESVYPYREAYKIVLAGAPGLSAEDYESYLKDYPEVKLQFGKTYELVRESRLALVTSGTATLETALIGTPQIVLYRMRGQRIARFIFRHLFSTRFISLVNLILQHKAVPELIGSEVSVREIQRHMTPLLADTSIRREQSLSSLQLRKILGQGSTAEQAAKHILTRLHQLKQLCLN